MDVWIYFQQRERDCRELSLAPIGDYWRMVSAEHGSNDKRGRVFGAFALTDRFHLHVSEVVVVQNNHVHREEYGYFLTRDGVEIWGRSGICRTNLPSTGTSAPSTSVRRLNRYLFRAVVERAWDEVTRDQEYGDEPPFSNPIDG